MSVDAPAAPTVVEWLTAAEVARELRVSVRTVLRWTAPTAGKDRLLAMRVGSVTRVRRTTLDNWIRERSKS